MLILSSLKPVIDCLMTGRPIDYIEESGTDDLSRTSYISLGNCPAPQRVVRNVSMRNYLQI